LVDSEFVLRRLQDWADEKYYTRVLTALKAALGLDRADIAIARGGGVRISGRGIGKDIPLEGWADGYRLTFSWMLDFLGWAMRAKAIDTTGTVRGVLLLDEIEQHLHPSMQGPLLERLTRLLPEVQVVTTTHSPLVALGAAQNRVLALHRRGGNVTRADLPSLDGYSAEDALVSDLLFGTDPYAPRTLRKLERHEKLAQKAPDSRTPEETEELRQLAREVAPPPPSKKEDPVLAEAHRVHAKPNAGAGPPLRTWGRFAVRGAAVGGCSGA